MPNRIKVLIVDDSALARAAITRGLSADPAIVVVGAAGDPYEARDLMVRLRPDVLTLDIAMPRMDGVTFLKKFMSVMPTPTLVLSASADRMADEALRAGAFAVLPKPSAGADAAASMAALVAKVKAAATSQRAKPSVAPAAAGPEIVAIGASTGGVQALGRILPMFPAQCPPVVIVQHMPEGVTREFAMRLDEQCVTTVREAEDGDRLQRGYIYVAPGGTRHTEVLRRGDGYAIRLVQGPPVTGHVPSVDALFFSLAACGAASVTAACVLTGMGADGAKGLLMLRVQGARTYGQDRATCAVWGMPAAVEALGAAQRFLPLDDVPAALLEASTRARLEHD